MSMLTSWWRRKGGLGPITEKVGRNLSFLSPGIGGLVNTAGGLIRGERVGKALTGGVKTAALGAGGQALGAGLYTAAAPVVGAGASSPNAGAALARILGKGGDALDWLSDPKAGANRTALLTNLLSTGTGIMAGRAQGAVEDEDRAYTRERDAAADARKAEILALLMKRFGGTP